jgi:hypothetical protein
MFTHRWEFVIAFISEPDEHLEAFTGELREAVVAESPERVETALFDWQQVAEVHAGTRST